MSKPSLWASAVVGFALSCSRAPSDGIEWVHLEPDDWEISAMIPGEVITALAATPDDVLFASTNRALYRARIADSAGFSEVLDYTDLFGHPDRPNFDFRQLFAPTGRTVFVLTRGAVFRWSEGEGASDFTSDTLQALMTDLWGRSASDVYAVGYKGTLLHYDGEDWELQSNPLLEGPLQESNVYDLRAVAGDEDELFLANHLTAFRLHEGTWDVIPQPEPPRCGILSMAMHDDALYFAGGERLCFARLADGDWQWLIKLWRRSDMPFHAADQPDGSALFYSNRAGRAVYEVGEEGLRAYLAPDSSVAAAGYGAAAATANGDLYLARRSGNDAVLLRIPSQIRKRRQPRRTDPGRRQKWS